MLEINHLNSNHFQQKAYGFYIFGTTNQGETFRPSDWIDRLCGIMASFVPKGMTASNVCYSPYVQPMYLKYEENIENIKENKEVRVVCVDYRIAEIEPKALQFLKDFAKNNNLKVEMIYQPIITS